MKKTLSFVTVPIGNLDDITLKAINKLKSIEYILCEDTRMSRKLLSLLEIDCSGKRIISFHEHSDSSFLNQFNHIEDIVYISDAGSPVISDPASSLIDWAQDNDRKIQSFSGISSAINALEVSGLKVSQFSFHGFIPRVKSQKVQLFEKIQNFSGIHIFFESPNRVRKTLKEVESTLLGKRVVIARELTKKFESVYSFVIDEDWEKNLPETIKGECVLMVQIEKESVQSFSNSKLKEIAIDVLENPKKKNISKLLAKILEMDSKEVYKKLI